MPSRLGMAALAVAAIVAGPGQGRAGDPPVENRVNLELQISGLGRDGCEIEIRPGHPGCQFRPIARIVDPTQAADPLKLAKIPIVAQSTGPDRDCSFTITVKEPGRPPATFRRGVRLSLPTASKPLPEQSLKCLLNTAAVARNERDRPRR